MSTKGKKLLFVTHALSGGGAERVLVSLANYFSERGYYVTIVSRTYDKDHYPIDEGVDVCYLETSSHISFIRRLRGEIIRSRVKNVIAFEYFYNMCSAIACLGLGINLIVSERNDPARIGGSFPKKYIRNFLYRFVNILVCQTGEAKDYFPSYIRKKSRIILNPIKKDIPTIYNGERRSEVVNFCRLNAQKNIPLLIESFELFLEKYPNYKMVIYGDGPEKDRLHSIINNKGLEEHISLKGNCSDVLEKVKDAMMFVSTSDYEGLSNSMLEAMAIGLPVICTDCPCGGARMVIDGTNGILIPVRNVDSVAEAMSQIASDKDLRYSLSLNASKLKDDLSINKIGRVWESLIKLQDD